MKEILDSQFGIRLRQAFQGVKNAEIARQLSVSSAAVTNYMEGRVPSSETLILISTLTNCSIHWLLTGQGVKEIIDLSQEEIIALEDIGRHLHKSVAETLEQLVREKLDELGKIEFDEITIPIYQMYDDLSAEKKVEIADQLVRQIMAKAS